MSRNQASHVSHKKTDQAAEVSLQTAGIPFFKQHAAYARVSGSPGCKQEAASRMSARVAALGVDLAPELLEAARSSWLEISRCTGASH